MAQRYGQLPSHILDHGTTQDLEIMLTAWDEQQRQEMIADLKRGTRTRRDQGDKYSQEELSAMIGRVRGQNDQGGPKTSAGSHRPSASHTR
jgi:hypothetical protein